MNTEEHTEEHTEDYTNYINIVNGEIMDVETYLLNILGYNYSPKNKNTKLYTKSLQFIKKSKTFRDLITNITNVVKSIKEVDEKDVNFILEELHSLKKNEKMMDNKLEPTGINVPYKEDVEVYGGSPISDSEWFSLIKKYSPSATKEDTLRVIQIIRCFFDFVNCPCTEEGIYNKLNVEKRQDRGHWTNTSKLNKNRPFKELFPRVSTNVAAYLWTVNACGVNKKSIYSHTTDVLRKGNYYDTQHISPYLTELYMAIISYHYYEEYKRKPLTWDGKAVKEQQCMPSLYRGEKLIYNPELIGLPKESSGKIKWADITTRDSNGRYVLQDKCKTGNKCVFSGFTATTPNIALAGYFCTSKNEDPMDPVTDEFVQVLYVMEGINHEYAGWFYDVQAFKEEENLCLPGLIAQVTDINYLHHREAEEYWTKIRPKSGANIVTSGLNRPLLVININILGISCHLPGLNQELMPDVLTVLNPYLTLLPGMKAPKILVKDKVRKRLDRSPSLSPRTRALDLSILPQNLTEYDNFAIPITAYIAYYMLPLFDGDALVTFKFIVIIICMYVFMKNTITGKSLFEYGDKQYGGNLDEIIETYRPIMKNINKLLSSIENIGDILTNYSKIRGALKRKKRKKSKMKRKKDKRSKGKKKKPSTKKTSRKRSGVNKRNSRRKIKRTRKPSRRRY